MEFFYYLVKIAVITLQIVNEFDPSPESDLVAPGTGKSLSEALLFGEHEENMLCTEIVLNVKNNFCTQHVLPRFELRIFMY